MDCLLAGSISARQKCYFDRCCIIVLLAHIFRYLSLKTFIFFCLETGSCFFIDLASAVTKAKRQNQQGAKQREVRAGLVLLLGLQVHGSHGTLLVCCG